MHKYVLCIIFEVFPTMTIFASLIMSSFVLQFKTNMM